MTMEEIKDGYFNYLVNEILEAIMMLMNILVKIS